MKPVDSTLQAMSPASRRADAARILLSVNSSWNACHFRGNLIRALAAAGHEVIVAAPPDRFSPRLAGLGCRYYPLPMDVKGTSPLRDLACLARYLHLLRQLRPSHFLGFTVKPNIYGSLAAHALKIPVINTVTGLGTAFIARSWLTGIVRRLYRLAFARSRAVFFQNADDLALFVGDRLVDDRQAALLPGSGIDLDRFRPVARQKAPEALTFLLLGRMLRDKGIGEFVAAARLVRQTAPKTRFALLGPCDVENRSAIDRATIEGWVAEGVIEYLGAQDDVRPALAAAHCVVLPSYREGMPRALLEAAAMATPLIAADVPGCREIVADGENGLLCRVRDPEDLARAMLAMIALPEDARAAMGAAGRARIERDFDEKLVFLRYLAAIADHHGGAAGR